MGIQSIRISLISATSFILKDYSSHTRCLCRFPCCDNREFFQKNAVLIIVDFSNRALPFEVANSYPVNARVSVLIMVAYSPVAQMLSKLRGRLVDHSFLLFSFFTQSLSITRGRFLPLLFWLLTVRTGCRIHGPSLLRVPRHSVQSTQLHRN